MWYAKMYFSGEKEFFENDAFGMQGLPSKQLQLPFLESLLTFLELDEKEITPMLERISVNWERFVESRDREAYTAAMVELGVLAEKHIYLRLLYTRCYSCSSRRDLGKAPLQAITLDLKEFVTQFSETRKQVEKFLECVLDVDSAGREPQKQAAKNYHHDQPRNPELFRFEPIPLSFEPVEPGRCAPVLYSSAVRDMIDYSLRSCVERRSGKGGAVGAGAAPVIVAAVLAVFCVPCVGQLHQSGLAVRPGELPVLHELGDASHSFSSRVSVAFSLLCGRFSVFRYYFIKDFFFRKTVAIIGRMVWIFGFALTNRS